MNKDFRVAITFADHPKTHKLMRRCGDKSCWCLLRLWGFVAANKPDGNLVSMDGEDVEIAAGWSGEPGLFVAALMDLRILDGSPGSYSVHDWQDHNGYAAHAQERSEKASKAANARYKKTSTHAQSCSEHATSNAQSCSEQCPSPSPTPTPSPKNKDYLPSSGRNTPSEVAPPPGPEEGEIEIYPELDSMPIEFQDLVSGYPAGRVDLIPAFKAFKSLQFSPSFSIQAVLSDVAQRCGTEQWRTGFAPCLSKYLREQRWRDPIPEARAAPPPAYATPESKAIDDIAEKLRRKERQNEHELSESHPGECHGSTPAIGTALPEIQASRGARPPG